MTHKPGRSRWPIVLAVLALVYLVGVVFFPMLGYGFIRLDVGHQVVDNPHIQGLTGENLKHIFTSWCIYSFYPIRSLSFLSGSTGLDFGGSAGLSVCCCGVDCWVGCDCAGLVTSTCTHSSTKVAEVAPRGRQHSSSPQV